MICSKCGQPIKEGSLFCEYCGAPVDNTEVAQKSPIPEATYTQQKPVPEMTYTQQKPVPEMTYTQQKPVPEMTYAQQEPVPEETYIQPTPVPGYNQPEYAEATSAGNKTNIKPGKKNKEKGSKLIPAIIITTVVLLLAAGGIVAFLMLRGGKGSGDDGKGGDKSQNYYKPFDKDDIVFPQDDEAYVDNQLLIKAEKSAGEEDIKADIKEYKGDIVGYNSVTNIYQVEFPADRDKELTEMRDELNDKSDIVYATLHYVYYREAIVGTDMMLDNTLLGIGDADYDSKLVGDIGVLLIGSADDNSGIKNIVPNATVKAVSTEKDDLVSLFIWENEVTTNVAEGSKVVVVTEDLTPTFDLGEEEIDMNATVSEFINDMTAADQDFMIITPRIKSESSFLTDIRDAEAVKKVLVVGTETKPEGVIDILTTGAHDESIGYAAAATIMTWSNNVDLKPEHIREIMKSSYINLYEDSGTGVLDVWISTEVAKRLRDYATASDADAYEELTVKEIYELLDKVKLERLYGPVAETEEDETANDGEAGSLEEAAREIIDEDGYYEIGVDDLVSQDYGEGFNFTYRSRGLGAISAGMGDFVDGYDNSMVLFYTEDGDHLIMSLYGEKNGKAEKISETIIKDYYLKFEEDASVSGQSEEAGCGMKCTGVGSRDLDLKNIYIDCPDAEGDMGFHGESEYHYSYSADIKEIDGNYYVRIAIDSDALILYRISETGFTAEKAVLWDWWWGPGYYYMKPVAYDIKSGDIPALELSSRTSYDGWELGDDFYKDALAEIGCEDVGSVDESYEWLGQRCFALPSALFSIRRNNGTWKVAYTSTVVDNTLLNYPEITWWRSDYDPSENLVAIYEEVSDEDTKRALEKLDGLWGTGGQIELNGINQCQHYSRFYADHMTYESRIPGGNLEVMDTANVKYEWTEDGDLKVVLTDSDNGSYYLLRESNTLDMCWDNGGYSGSDSLLKQ